MPVLHAPSLLTQVWVNGTVNMVFFITTLHFTAVPAGAVHQYHSACVTEVKEEIPILKVAGSELKNAIPLIVYG